MHSIIEPQTKPATEWICGRPVQKVSPTDRRRNVDEKIRVYLACGAGLVAIADPESKNVVLHDASGVVTLKVGDALRHSELPSFAMPIAEIFAKSGQR